MSSKINCPLNKLLINLEIKARRESGYISNTLQSSAHCHTCKMELDIDRFYSSRGITDTYRCKGCYKKEFR